MLLLQLAIAFTVGGALGLLIGWLLMRGRPAASDDSGLQAELRRQIADGEAKLAQTQLQLSDATQSRAKAEALQGSAEKLLEEQKQIHERNLLAAKQAQDQALSDLRAAFRALSAEVLQQTAPEFLRLAEQSLGKFQETAKGDLAQRQEAIKTLVEPLKQQLETYQRRLQQSESAQSSTLGEVKKQLDLLAVQSQSLATETQQFRAVLKNNQARGRWGEETLRRVVEAAGMSAHCDFTEQTQSGENRPDLVVRLPGDRFIIVDAKVPDLEFLSALETSDVTKRAEFLAAHAKRLRETIKSLAERDYPREYQHSLDYVVLFLPAESLFSAALESDPNLIIWAAERHILLATPASLIALLRSVSVSWQQHAQTENAQKIAEAAKELYARVRTFAEHFENIRAGLDRANTAFNSATSSYQTRVRPQGERLAELGGGTGKELTDLQALDTTAR